MSPAVTLQQLVRRAELYGTELVYGTAERDLHMSVEDLGCLALALRRIDPEWKLTRPSPRRRDQVGQRNRLVFGLLGAGWPDKRIRGDRRDNVSSPKSPISTGRNGSDFPGRADHPSPPKNEHRRGFDVERRRRELVGRRPTYTGAGSARSPAASGPRRGP